MIVTLAGGVGGSKLLSGLSRRLDPSRLMIIANTGDDIELHGLRVCPDLDTILYTLAGIENPETGWGLAGDTFACLDALSRFAGKQWFQLGDRDLATHVWRTERLRQGASLSQVAQEQAATLGLPWRVLPMSDDYAPTRIRTDKEALHVQEYLVRERAAPAVRGITVTDGREVDPAPGLLESIASAAAIFLCPSNPFISIHPILALRGVREALAQTEAPIVAVSPIVEGRSLKGPLGRMMSDLGLEVSALAIARLYRSLVDHLVIDLLDSALASAIEKLGIQVHLSNTVMRQQEDKDRLADFMLRHVVGDLRRSPASRATR